MTDEQIAIAGLILCALWVCCGVWRVWRGESS